MLGHGDLTDRALSLTVRLRSDADCGGLGSSLPSFPGANPQHNATATGEAIAEFCTAGHVTGVAPRACTAEQKVALLQQLLVDNEPMSTLRDENAFLLWVFARAAHSNRFALGAGRALPRMIACDDRVMAVRVLVPRNEVAREKGPVRG